MTKSLFSRRHFLGYGMVAALAGYASKVWAKPVFSASPFTLGVASGYPEPNGVCLWTRLAPEFLAPDGGMPPEAVAVSFEIAEDQAFKSIVDQGQAWAEPIFAHSVHLETTKLAPGRDYWYRFHVADLTSPAGHTRSAPAGKQAPTTCFPTCQEDSGGAEVGRPSTPTSHPGQ
jgi:alkaline phosphatase D